MSKVYMTPVDKAIPFDPTGTSLVSENVRDAIIETLLNAGSSRFAVIFGYNGNASSTRYLEMFQSVPSSTSPFVVAEIGEIVSLSISTKNTATLTATVYVNAVAITTISLAAAASGYISGLTEFLNPGDVISAAVTSGSGQDPILSVNVKVAA